MTNVNLYPNITVRFDLFERQKFLKMLLEGDPIVIRPDGNITLFGLTNHFSTDMPSKLLSIIAPDEYKYTIKKLNKVLYRRVSMNFKIFLLSCVCCCCTGGLSLCPSLIMSNHTREKVRIILEKENERIYNKLGMHWTFSKYTYGSLPMVEYVILIHFLNCEKIHTPD